MAFLVLIVFAAAVVVSIAILAPLIPAILGMLAVLAVLLAWGSVVYAAGAALYAAGAACLAAPYVAAAVAVAAGAIWTSWVGAQGLSLCLWSLSGVILTVGWIFAANEREQKRLNRPKSDPYTVSTELAPEHRLLLLAERRGQWLNYWSDRYINRNRYTKAKDIANYLEYSRSHRQLRLPSWEEWVCFEIGRPRKRIGHRCHGYTCTEHNPHSSSGLTTVTKIARGRLTPEDHAILLEEATYDSETICCSLWRRHG